MTTTPSQDNHPESARLFRRKADIVTRIIADETWLIPIAGHLTELGQIYHLNDAGADIWNQLDGETTLDTIREQITDSYDVDADTAARDIGDQIAELLEAGLIEENVSP